MCHPVALLTNGLSREVELEEKSLEDFNAKYDSFAPVIVSSSDALSLRERLEHSVFKELLKMVPGLEDRIQDFDELETVADHVSVFSKCSPPSNRSTYCSFGKARPLLEAMTPRVSKER